jgi:murein DD-endopeptidase MepM/ murein hydrolase activator NlpD
VTDIRALRLSRGLTLIDLALLTDIPARTLAQIEYGLQRLDYESRSRLARIFDVRPELLRAGGPRPAIAARKLPWLNLAGPALGIALAGALLLTDPLLQMPPLASLPLRSGALLSGNHPQPAGLPIKANTLGQIAASRAAALAAPTTVPTATTAPPTPTQPQTPRFMLAADGPHGCPLAPASGRVVLTQGYNVGTHAPASIWGAVDLAIDSDGDGFAEPNTTQGLPILATHGGVAHVYLGSWPGGNFVRVVDEQASWSTAYAHLDTVAVADGQLIPDGATIGTVGSTGMASGPHLHYEVWHGEENVDPTGLIGCELPLSSQSPLW